MDKELKKIMNDVQERVKRRDELADTVAAYKHDLQDAKEWLLWEYEKLVPVLMKRINGK